MPALVESCAISTVVWRTIASISSFTSMNGKLAQAVQGGQAPESTRPPLHPCSPLQAAPRLGAAIFDRESGASGRGESAAGQLVVDGTFQHRADACIGLCPARRGSGAARAAHGAASRFRASAGAQ